MIIYGFSDSINRCSGTLTGDNYKVANQEDQLSPRRRAVSAPVSGAGGAYDYYRTYAYPQEPLVVTTRGTYFDTTWSTVGTNLDAMMKTALTYGRAKLFFVPHSEYLQHALPTYNQVLHAVAGTLYIGELPTAYGRVFIKDLNGVLIAQVSADNAGNWGVFVPAGVYNITAQRWFMTYAPNNDYSTGYSGFFPSNPLTVSGVTVGVDIDLTADGATQYHRWAYAKCLRFHPLEGQKAPRWTPFEAEFELAEGVFYGTRRVVAKTHASAATFDLTMNGSHRAMVKLTLTANTNPITAFSFTNNDNLASVSWAGALAASKSLIIDSAAYSITNDGADAYAALTLGSGQVTWMALDPQADNTTSCTVAVTQTTADNWGLTIEYYDTYASL